MDDKAHATAIAAQPASTHDAMKNINNNNNNEEYDTPIHDKVTDDENDHGENDGEKSAAVTASATTIQIQDITDKALRFISHASNETLGACLVGLGATTYFILGRVGLLLIGVVGGIALHATWDSAHSSADRLSAKEVEQKKRRELGLEVIQRVLQWNDNKEKAEDTDDEDAEIKPLASKKSGFSTFRPDTAAALGAFTDAIIRDYVNWWYSPVLPGEDSFPAACRQTLVSFLVSLSNHLSRKRPVDTFLDFVTNSSSIVIVFLNELAAALNASPNATSEDAVHAYLETKPESSLASIMDAKHQEKKLKVVANDILLKYLDNKTYMCAPAHIFLKQVLAKLVLSMTVDSCSKPEFINQWIVYLLEDGEPELMEVIDAGVEGSAVVNDPSSKKPVTVDDQAEKPASSPEAIREHRRKESRNKAEEAMDEAMKEAQRLSQLIAEEEAKRSNIDPSTLASSGDVSETTTQGIMTPSSSQGDADDNTKSEPSRASPTAKSTEKLSEDSRKPFTSFDQILPATSPTALSSQEDKLRLKPPPALTLHNASINIFDDASPGNNTVLRSKPNIDYMIQIEPTSSSFPGWMIVRKYTDFESLHEVLRRISVITGTRFTDSHANLPTWKNNTKHALRTDLERYLNDAVRLQPLAESEGMKRFLDKDGGASRSPGGSKGFGWPTPVAFDQMGKNMMDTLTKAPIQVAGGGKAIFGGVTSILGGGKRNSVVSNHNASRSSISLNPANFLEDSYMGTMGNVGVERQSTDSIRSVPAPPSRTPSLSKRVPSAAQSIHRAEQSVDRKSRPSLSSPRASYQGTGSEEYSRTSSSAGLSKLDTELHLPPLPSDIPDDYASQTAVSAQPARIIDDMTYASPDAPAPASSYPTSGIRSRGTSRSPEATPARVTSARPIPATTTAATKATKITPPISEQETQVAVELMFAVITELYTLSSAWNIRRTLLNAAKSFLLRPGNPQLEAIRQLIQTNVIETFTSDSSIAAQILKIRENSLPTEEELKSWPKEMSVEDKEALRVKARGLLIERGMPAALTSVMGAAASGEALGRVFDCLQVDGVGRGVVFGVLLQALRAVVQ
ncbi:hypothetical protein E4T39_03958 [Aureobasidium subglaciale]|nr:hypothetical protein E4T39_03958 [Aureobasidium subglaciale]